MHMPKPCTIEILFDWIITNALKGENNDERRDEYRTLQKQDRWRLNQHKSGVIWFTGLSGSGKSTLANEMDKRFYQMGIHSCLLDGDALRFGLNKDLGFSRDDRKENIRRAGEISKMMADAGLLVLASFISPYQSDRDMVRRHVDNVSGAPIIFAGKSILDEKG